MKVVDPFELVEVEQDDRGHAAGAFLAMYLVFGRNAEEAAVQQAGQRVGGGQGFKLALVTLQLELVLGRNSGRRNGDAGRHNKVRHQETPRIVKHADLIDKDRKGE